MKKRGGDFFDEKRGHTFFKKGLLFYSIRKKGGGGCFFKFSRNVQSEKKETETFLDAKKEGGGFGISLGFLGFL